MARKIYVVDQNVMRREGLAELIAAQPKAKFVVPDTGLVEMVKSDLWEETFRRSFAVFAPVATRCAMSMSVQEAREFEIKQRISVAGQLLPRDFTKLLRGAIKESQSGSGPTMSLLRDRMAQTRKELQQDDLNARANRIDLQSLVSDLRSGLSKGEIKACRQAGTEARLARIAIAYSVGDALYVAHMRHAGVPDSVSRRLWKAMCMTRRWCYLRVHHALQWLGDGGLDTATDEAILNDILDQDYVLVGSFFSGVLSRETDVTRASEDLRAMLVLPPSPNAPVARDAPPRAEIS